jgi:hypothetical protein
VVFVPQEIMQLTFSNKITQKLTWNPMQAQTEPKLHPETANMDFEQVITKRSATLKGGLKVNLEPVFLENSMLVTFVRPYFSLRIAITFE